MLCSSGQPACEHCCCSPSCLFCVLGKVIGYGPRLWPSWDQITAAPIPYSDQTKFPISDLPSKCVSYFNHFVLHHTPISDPELVINSLKNGSPDIILLWFLFLFVPCHSLVLKCINFELCTVVVLCVCVCVCVCFQGPHLQLTQLSDKVGILAVSV